MATSITSQPGRDFAVRVADGSASPPVYSLVGGVRSTELTINDNPVDITNIGSNGFQEWLPNGGIFQATVSCEGIFDSLTTGAQTVNTAAINRTLIEVELESGHGDKFYFDAAIQDFSRSAPHDNVEQFSFTLVSHNNVQYEPSA